MRRISGCFMLLIFSSLPASLYAATNAVLSVDALLNRFVLSRSERASTNDVIKTVEQPNQTSDAGLLQGRVVDELLSEGLSTQVDQADWHLERAHQYLIDQNALGAAVEYAHILRRQPTHEKALEGLGLSFARLGNDRGAYMIYTSLLDAHPKVSRYKLQMAALHYRIGAYEKAWELLRQIPGTEFVFERAYLAGILSYAQGRHARAVKMLHQAIHAQPSQHAPLRALAEVYASMGEREAALRVLQHLKGRIDPDSYALFIALPVFHELHK